MSASSFLSVRLSVLLRCDVVASLFFYLEVLAGREYGFVYILEPTFLGLCKSFLLLHEDHEYPPFTLPCSGASKSVRQFQNVI